MRVKVRCSVTLIHVAIVFCSSLHIGVLFSMVKDSDLSVMEY